MKKFRSGKMWIDARAARTALESARLYKATKGFMGMTLAQQAKKVHGCCAESLREAIERTLGKFKI